MMEHKEEIKRFYEEVIYCRLIKMGYTQYRARGAALQIVDNLNMHSLVLGPY